jgi:hypothetical protein
MVGVLLALVLSQPAMPSASVTCPDGPASCDVAWIVAADAPEAPAAPRDYATPAEVDCEGPAEVAALASECDEVSLDFWYRVSRLPESETGSLVPTRHGRGRMHSAFGAPPERGQLSAPQQQQPLALFAVPGLMLVETPADLRAETRRLPARVVAPPDRPPR